MASNIPTRRATRSTRTYGARENENAVTSRGSRLTSRIKPPSKDASSGTSSIPTGIARAMGTTAASRAKTGEGKSTEAVAGKRKREALGEVVGVSSQAKGKGTLGKEGKEGVIKSDKAKATTVTSIRQPFKHVSTQSANTTGAKRVSKILIARENTTRPEINAAQLHDDDAMAVDLTHSSRVTTSQTATTLVTEHISTTIVEEEEEERVAKRARTSSDAPEEPQSRLHELKETSPEVEELPILDSEAEVEADPDGNDWNDLDAEDHDDPIMVSEYVVEIFEYMKAAEKLTMPNARYMESHKDLNWTMRGVLCDWLIDIHSRFGMMPETLFLAVNLIDRFLSARVVSLAKLQLVGITCLFIASKVEETISPSVEGFLAAAEESYTVAEILQAEQYILKTLDWDLRYPSPMNFLRRVSKADDYEPKTRTVAKYLIELSCVEWRLIAAPPSLLSAAGYWLARLILGNETWTPNLAHYSGYAESSLLPAASLMLNYILKPVKHENFYRKYAGKRFMKVSLWCREWALSRFDENTKVDLHEILPQLKSQARSERVAVEERARRKAAGDLHRQDS